MAHQRGKREQEGVPITCRCQFLTWDSEGKSTREEAFESALMFIRVKKFSLKGGISPRCQEVHRVDFLNQAVKQILVSPSLL